MWGSLNKITNISVLNVFKNVLVQSAAFVISSLKVKESMWLEMHIMRAVLCVLVVGKRNIYILLTKREG